MTTRTTTTPPSAIAIKALAGVAGALIIGCVTHYAVAAIGGYGAAGAPLLMALAAGLVMGAIVIGVSWHSSRKVLALLTAFALLCGESYALINTGERTLEQREARMAPIRKVAAHRAELDGDVAKAEAALAALSTTARIETARIETALAAKAATEAAAINAVKERSCVDRCKTRIDASVDDAKREVEAARSELGERRAAAERKIADLKSAIAALPVAETQSILAATLGVDGWKIDLLAAALISIAANGLGSLLLAFSVHLPAASRKTTATSVPSFSDTTQSSFSTGDDAAQARTMFSGPLPENDEGPVSPLPPKGGKRRDRKTTTKVERKTMPSNVVPLFGAHPVIRALADAGRPLSNDELAHAMGCSSGEASKRWKEVAGDLDVGKNGRHLAISLKEWSRSRAAC